MAPIILVPIATPTPTTWTDTTLITQSLLNGEIRDPLRFIVSGCSTTVRLANSQSIPNNTNTDISWDTQVTDVDGIISVPGSEFVFTRDGVIAVRFYGTFNGATGGTIRHFKIQLDSGSGYVNVGGVSDGVSVSSALQQGLNLSIDLAVLAGYKVKFTAFQDSGSSLNVNAAKTQATLTWVGKTADFDNYDSGQSDNPSPSPPPTNSNPTKHTATYSATFSRSYISDGSARWDDPNTCYQGSYPGYGGNQRSLVGFDSSSLVSDLNGAQKVSMQLKFHCSHPYYNSGMTAIIGLHDYSSKPSSWGDSHVYQDMMRTHIGEGSTKTISLNSTMVSKLKSGQYKGIAFGPAPNSGLGYYGFFAGNGASNEPKLEVTYYK